MKKEMFDHVAKHFKLAKYDDLNGNWEKVLLECVVQELFVHCRTSPVEYTIETNFIVVFYNLPSREKAQEILDYMKEIEVLFI